MFLIIRYLPSVTTYYHVYLDNASINPNAITPIFSKNYSQCFIVDGCRFENSRKYKNLIGNNFIGCYIDLWYNIYEFLNVGVKIERGVYYFSGASVVAPNFNECDRGLIGTGLSSLWVNQGVFLLIDPRNTEFILALIHQNIP